MNNANTTAASEPAMLINGKLYVVTESVGQWKTVIGPKGGTYTLFSKRDGSVELMQRNMRMIWKGRL